MYFELLEASEVKEGGASGFLPLEYRRSNGSLLLHRLVCNCHAVPITRVTGFPDQP